MRKRHNIWWFIGLGTLSSLLFIYTMIKKRDKKLLSLFFCLAGLGYFFDFIVFVVFKSYRYYPRIFKNKYFDNVLGSAFSQLLTIPSVTLLLTAFQLRSLFWKLAFSGILMAIEELFLRLKIYKHYWWKTSYTGIGTTLLFYFSDFFYKLLRNPNLFLVRVCSVFFKVFTIYTTFIFFMVAIFQSHYFRVKIAFSGKRGRQHVMLATGYSIIISIIFTTMIMINRVWSSIVGLSCIAFIDVTLYRNRILKFGKKWSLRLAILAKFCIFPLLYIFDKWLYKNENDDVVS